MTWRAVATFLLGLGLGYLLGEIGRESSPARAPRGGEARGVPDLLSLPSGDAPGARAPESLPNPVAPEAAVVVAGPTGATEDVDPQLGTLVVDFTGFDGPAYVRIEGADLEGNLDYMEEGAADGIVSVDLYPCEVTVRWESGGAMRRFAARARIEAGRVTRVLAADARHTPLPDPPGLAILDVRVADADGSRLAGVAVHLGGAGFGYLRWVSILTDGAGHGRFRVRAGSYEIQAGNRTDALTLRTGERRSVELRHESHGEVVVEPRLEGHYWLEPRDRQEAMEGAEHLERAVRFLFVPAGSYNLFYRFSRSDLLEVPRMGDQPGTAAPGSRLLARLDVRPGRTERFAHRPEPGFLEVQVLPPGSGVARRWEARVSGEAKVSCGLEPREVGYGARVGPLPIARYGVEIVADGEILASRSAIVAYGPTEVVVDLRQ